MGKIARKDDRVTGGRAINGDLTEKDRDANSIAQRRKENRRNGRVAKIEGLPVVMDETAIAKIDLIGPIARRLRQNRCRRLR
jgi:hypothetical protein